MKVLHIIPSVATVRGGPSQVILEEVKALRDSSVEVEIATTNDNGPNLLNVPLGKCIEYQNIPVWFFPRFSPPIDLLREFAFSWELTYWLWQNIRRYDLLHIHAIFSYPSTIAMAIARLKGVPYIVRPLGQLCEWSLRQSVKRKKIYLRLIEQANLNSSNFLHFTSTQEQQEASLLHLSSPSFILPHGLALPDLIPQPRQRLRQKLNLPADEPIILFLSRLHPKKGLDYLIPALGKLSNYRFTFIIAGSGDPDYEQEVKSLLVAHGIENRTQITGFVTGEFKDLLLQGADLFALTSYSENFGVAVLEALAVGLPVLVTPGVALADLIKQQQIGYVTQLDVEDIASSIENILAHPLDAVKIGDHARQLIFEQYTWEPIARKMIAVYSAIIQNKSLVNRHDSRLIITPSAYKNHQFNYFIFNQYSMLENITPLILTYNEEPNIDRTLQRLTWAKSIVVIDSFSTDKTLEILQSYPQVQVFQRKFDSFAAQCNFGLEKITSEWVLSLDADYILTHELINEIKFLLSASDVDSYSVRFKYCIFGKPLRGTLLPPRKVLYKKEKAVYQDDGHAHRVIIEGSSKQLGAYIYHDDRKPLSRWLWAQDRYMVIESKKLLSTPERELSLGDRIRKQKILAPLIILIYCLILKGGILDGWHGWYYAFQRVLAEILLSIHLIEAEKVKQAPDTKQLC